MDKRPELPKPLCWVNINKQCDVTHHSNKNMPWSRTPVFTAKQMREYGDACAAERDALLALLIECRCYITGDVGWDYDSNKWLPDRIDDAINAI